MVSLYELCITILAIGGIGIIIVLPNAWAADIDCIATTCGGTDGNDVIDGHDGDDQMWGNGGNDKMYGYGGDDSMVGNEGDDEISGSWGNDKIWGTNGNDIIVGGPGADYLVGGEGNDVIYHLFEGLSSDRSKDTIFCGEGYDIAWLGYREDTYGGDCEVTYKDKAPPLANNNPPPPPASNTLPPRACVGDGKECWIE